MKERVISAEHWCTAPSVSQTVKDWHGHRLVSAHLESRALSLFDTAATSWQATGVSWRHDPNNFRGEGGPFNFGRFFDSGSSRGVCLRRAPRFPSSPQQHRLPPTTSPRQLGWCSHVLLLPPGWEKRRRGPVVVAWCRPCCRPRKLVAVVAGEEHWLLRFCDRHQRGDRCHHRPLTGEPPHPRPPSRPASPLARLLERLRLIMPSAACL